MNKSILLLIALFSVPYVVQGAALPLAEEAMQRREQMRVTHREKSYNLDHAVSLLIDAIQKNKPESDVLDRMFDIQKNTGDIGMRAIRDTVLPIARQLNNQASQALLELYQALKPEPLARDLPGSGSKAKTTPYRSRF
jgi:hypothetical protein